MRCAQGEALNQGQRRLAGQLTLPVRQGGIEARLGGPNPAHKEKVDEVDFVTMACLV
jgi:hypothetical protein